MFFFQAEAGIRDIGVTGVQTCALPIFSLVAIATPRPRCALPTLRAGDLPTMLTIPGRSSRYCDGVSRRSFLRIGALGVGAGARSEERRVGTGRRCRAARCASEREDHVA